MAHKKKVYFECHTFKAQYSMNFFVIELDGKELYLLYSDTIAMLNGYTTNQHYQIEHSSQKTNSQIRKFKMEFSSQQNFLIKRKIK